MNTPESDMEQMKFAREWVRAHAAKKMAKYEKKLRRAAHATYRPYISPSGNYYKYENGKLVELKEESK